MQPEDSFLLHGSKEKFKIYGTDVDDTVDGTDGTVVTDRTDGIDGTDDTIDIFQGLGV